MLNRKINNLIKFLLLFVIIASGCFASAIAQAQTKFTAGVVLEKMPQEERHAYVAGVIEGLAYSRYVKDNPDETGSSCIYDWYYKNTTDRWVKTILPTFVKHKDKPVGVIIYVLTKRECGE